MPVTHTLHCDVSWMADNVDDVLARADLNRPFVVLIPGASADHPEKRWPYYPELAEILLAQGLRVVTVPGPDEMELCRGINGDMLLEPDGRYLNFFRLAGVLKKAAMVIGNDTGPTHIAAHLQVPGLALFSSHVPATFTGIQHGRFVWIEQANLSELPVAVVLKRQAPIVQNLTGI